MILHLRKAAVRLYFEVRLRQFAGTKYVAVGKGVCNVGKV